MSDNRFSTVPDITDKIVEITEESAKEENTIVLDLDKADSPVDQELPAIDPNLYQLQKSARLFFDIVREISRSSSLGELYDILIFSSIGQMGCVSASILHPSAPGSSRWVIADHQGVRLRNKNVTFKSDGLILNRAISENGLILISEYEKNIDAFEEYQKFVALGAKLIIPIQIEKHAAFVLLLGAKLMNEEYNEYDREFMRAVADISSEIYTKIYQIDEMEQQVKDLAVYQERLDLIDEYEYSVRKTGSTGEIAQRIQNEIKDLGVNSFAFFMRNEVSNCFDLVFCDKADQLQLQKMNFSISSDSAFITYCMQNDDYQELDDPVSSGMLAKIFSHDLLLKINLFGVYPYSVNGQLIGFLLLLRVEPEEYKRHIVQMKRFSRFVFSHLQMSKFLIFAENYVDMLQPQFTRLRSDLRGCYNLDIPFTVGVFTLKGIDELMQQSHLKDFPLLLGKIEQSIKKVLSATDYSFRTGYNSFAAVFPGKYRKAGLKAMAALRKEINRAFPVMAFSSQVFEYPGETVTLDAIFNDLV